MPDRVECNLGWYRDDWSEFRLRLVITAKWVTTAKRPRGFWLGAPISWKNHRRVVMIAGRPSVGPSKQHKDWAQYAVAELRRQWCATFGGPIPKSIPLNFAVRSYLPTKRLTDMSNLYQGPEDVMQVCQPKCKPGCKVHAGVIEDDSAIEAHNGSARLYDKDNPRVEITLTRYAGGDRESENNNQD